MELSSRPPGCPWDCLRPLIPITLLLPLPERSFQNENRSHLSTPYTSPRPRGFHHMQISFQMAWLSPTNPPLWGSLTQTAIRITQGQFLNATPGSHFESLI